MLEEGKVVSIRWEERDFRRVRREAIFWFMGGGGIFGGEMKEGN